MDSYKHQKRLNALINKGKKNKFLKIPILILVFFEIALYHISLKLQRNVIRLSFVFGLFFTFFLFGSFAIKNQDNSNHRESYTSSSLESMGDYQAVYAEDNEDIVSSNLADLNQASIDIAEEEEDTPINIEGDEVFYSADEILELDTESLDDNQVPINDSSLLDKKVADITSFDPNLWCLILINRQHPIPEDYEFELGKLKSGMRCDSRVINPLTNMLKAAKEDGVDLVLCSPYRDYNRQVELFNKKIDKYMKKGYSYAESYQMTSQAVTTPGASEHEAGLAFDIVTKRYALLNDGFGDTEAGKWLAENCYKYGFILRYPLGKEDITGIEYEPWHFRYVGKEAATYMTKEGLTLEEFTDLIKNN